ncbi:MAG: hypothetical protein LQ347_004817, partial [Umbilicaria vellea]
MQAAAFIKRTPMTVQGYLAALEKDEQNLKDFWSKDLQDHRRQRGFPNSVFRAWKILFKQMLKQDPLAAELLSLIAMLDPLRIPQTLLERSAEKKIDFWTAIMHYWLEQRSEKADYTGKALRLLAEELPSGEHKHRETCELMLAHAQAVLRYDCVVKDDLGHRAALLYSLGSFDWRQGRYISAYRGASEAYEINRKRSGEAATVTLDSLSLLAFVLTCQGKYEAAEKENRQALDGYDKVLGDEHPDTLISVYNLACLLRIQKTVSRCVYSLSQSLCRLPEDVGPGSSHDPDMLPELFINEIRNEKAKAETLETINQ